MAQRATRWAVCPEIPDDVRAAASHLPPVLAQLLYNRGVLGPGATDAGAIEGFLSPRWDGGLHDPFLLADMDRAVERILAAVDRREPIGVFGHYDADGITATVLLTETLLHLGGIAIPYLPCRADDYGVHDPGIGELAAQGVRLLVSVDCGIRSFGAPATAAELGMDVVMTDHHTVLREEGRDVLPRALAVVNPMRADCPYPCKSLAGVGVAFKLAQALLRAHAERSGRQEKHFAKWLLDLVCLGTVADVVDLSGENRTLVSLGLAVLGQAKRPGIRALLGVAKTNLAKLDVGAVGFQLAPRINAAARMESAGTSLQLLRARDEAAAAPLALQLDHFNRERQRLIRDAMEGIAAQYGDALAEHKAIVVSGTWAAGIIGLIAGKLSESFNRPAAVVESNGSEELHGSARSRPGFHIAEALGACGDLLTRYGGHAQAAGFSLPARNLDAFRERLQSLAEERITEEELEPVLPIDVLISPEQVTLELLAQARALEPCGPGNPAPLFGLTHARLASVEAVGTGGAHLRLTVERAVRPLKAMGWRMGARAAELRPGTDVSIAGSLKDDSYSGLMLEVVDLAEE